MEKKMAISGILTSGILLCKGGVHMSDMDLVTMDEMRDMLSIGKNAAYTILNSGELKAFKIGKVWKIPRQSVYDYIRDQVAKQNQ